MTDVKASIQDALGAGTRSSAKSDQRAWRRFFAPSTAAWAGPSPSRLAILSGLNLQGSDRIHREVSIAVALQSENISPWRPLMARIASRHLLRTFATLAVLSAATVGTVHAQVSILADLFKRAQTLNVNWEFFQPTSQPVGVSPGRMRGLLFEASFSLGRFPPPAGKSPRVARDSLAEIDSTLEVRRDSQRVSRTARWIVRERTSPDAASNEYDLELALGYGQMTGFSSSDTTYRVYGSLEEFPVVSLYLGFPSLSFPNFWTTAPRRRERPSIAPYLGVRIGFVRLSGFQAFVGSSTADTSTVYTASSSTYLVAGMAGLEISVVPRVDFFMEAGITQRRFDGIQYSATGSSIVSNKLPQTIQLRTYGLTLGAQLSLQP